MSELRWPTVDGPGGDAGQETLFDADELAGHHVGSGEFRGMEFLHVRARTIINRIPPAAQLPFSHTINVYRGCSHACSYCFARPTHHYLGLGIGEDFQRKIVVKVNAVELLRSELAAKRWQGHHIAMGTNTDPYQRCEGKYRLTRGVVEVLAEQANPFSILTKSTLILSDLGLLVEAAKRTDLRVNLSIGTLDEDVWRLTEPGTPPPRRRVEAVRRLRAAGLDCGVLVAPVLPGLSDRAEQLEEVIDACVGAGATSISAVPLHLRPGLRDHYLGWLERERPDLLEDNRRRYTRAYLPVEDRKELAALVRRLVDRARARRRPSAATGWCPAGESRLVEGSFTRRVRAQMGGDEAAPAAAEPAPEAVQLGLL